LVAEISHAKQAFFHARRIGGVPVKTASDCTGEVDWRATGARVTTADLSHPRSRVRVPSLLGPARLVQRYGSVRNPSTRAV
jgi:hypothetical protein